MEITLSKGVIIVICASVGGLILAAGSFLVIKLLRLKYKRFPPLTRETSQRRLSRYSGGNFSFTDTDFARTPGTRTKLRRSINNPYSNPRNDWASIPSRENLPRRVALPRSHQTLAGDQSMNSPNAEGRRWPVPPRLKRTNAIPLSAIKTSPSIRLVERAPENFDTFLTKSQFDNPIRINTGKRIEHSTEGQIAGLQERLQTNFSLEARTKPKPLFYGKQRSISTSVIGQGGEGNSKVTPTDLSRTVQGQTGSPLVRQSSLPRSSSLFAQQPGKAPSIPVPNLPSEVSARIQRIKSPTDTDTGNERPSNTSFVSDYTSLVDDRVSSGFSHTDADFTSIGLKSPAASRFSSEGLGIDLESGVLEKTRNFLRTDDLCAEMGSQQSLATSIQQGLPRDSSSGLRFSMYDRSQSRNESSTTLSKDMSPNLVLKAPGSADRRSLGQQAMSSGLIPARSRDNKNSGNTQTSQVSASILKDVSGNERSPLKWGNRPSSIVAGDPFPYNHDLPTRTEKSSATPRESRHHRRKNCVRLSNPPTTVLVDTTFPTVNKGLTVVSTDPPISGLFDEASVPDQAMSRPPSKATFSSHTDITKQRQSLTVKAENTDPPSLSTIGLYKHSDSSSESICFTPTRKPSGRNPSIIQPGSNRGSIFLSLNPYDPETAPNLPIFPDLNIPQLLPNNAKTSPNSFGHASLNFDDPPKALESTSRRKSPLHGPRAPPHRSGSPARRSPTRQLSTKHSMPGSPTGSGVAKHEIPSASSPRNKQLLNSIMDLRRMNSDVSKSGSDKAHRRFRSLENAEHAIDEVEAGIEQLGRIGTKEKLTESMKTPKQMPELEIPRLLFSASRKEDGLWEAPKWAIGHGDDALY